MERAASGLIDDLAEGVAVDVIQGYAKNAYPWLISQDRSAVRTAHPKISESRHVKRSIISTP